MWKPRTLLILVACLAIIGALAFALAQPREPSYKGHTLSYWLEISDSNDEAQTAINAIGTNAIPSLLRWISYEPPAWRDQLAHVASKHKHAHLAILLYGREPDRAIVGFRMLGTNAAPAIPALATLMKDTAHRDPAIRAMWALGDLGQHALPVLTNELSNTNQLRRKAILAAIATMPLHGTPTNACLIPLLNATTDSDPIIRQAATRFIRSIAPEYLTNSPPP